MSLTRIAMQHLGTPWDPPAMDCWRLLMLIYREAYGIEVPRIGADARDPRQCLVAARREMGSGRWHEIDRPQPGDAALCAPSTRGWHVAVALNRRDYIHCAERCLGVAVADRYELEACGMRVVSHWRHRERLT